LTPPPERAGRRGTFPCPACGAPVPEGAISCKACGADEQTGWAEDDPATTEQDLGLERSLSDERYDEFVREELEGGTIETEGPSRWGCLLVVLAIAAVAALLGLLVTSGHR